MVETDRSRVRVQPAETGEPQQLGRPKRERQNAETQEVPLQQVETRK